MILIFTVPGNSYAQNSFRVTKKIYYLSELMIGYGLQGNIEPNHVATTGITGMVGYSINSSGGLGAGTGINAYNGSYSVPLYLDGGYYFREFGLARMRFYVKADAGALFTVHGEIPPTRVFINPMGGMLFLVAPHREVSVSLGFLTQWNPNYQDYYEQNKFDYFINVKGGFRFFRGFRSRRTDRLGE